MEFFGGHQRKSLAQIKAHLIAKNTFGSGAGSVAFLGAVFKHVSH